MPGITYEPVVTFGNLLAIACMVVPVLLTYFYVVRLLARLEAKVDIVWRTSTAFSYTSAQILAIKDMLAEHDSWERRERK